MASYNTTMVNNALLTRPAPSGPLYAVPRHEKYLFCPETDWLYSTKMSLCEMYPLQKILPETWNDMFEGFKVSDNGHKCSLSIRDLRKLKETQKMWPNDKQVNNAENPSAVDFKGKFLIGSIHKETGAVSFSAFPARQPTLEAAKKEAARLAQSDKSKHFMAVEVKAIASVQEVVFL